MTELLARNLSQSVGYFEPNMKVGIISNYFLDKKKLFVLHNGWEVFFWFVLTAEREISSMTSHCDFADKTLKTKL
jgi:hypothetical protein